jgi:Holliday junction resolvase
MGGLTSRLKGQRGEREVAEILRRHGFQARRGFQARGEEEPDVVTALPGFRIEVKRCERLDLWRALRQIDDAIDPEDDVTVPLLVFRRNRSRWYAALPFEDLLDLIARVVETTRLGSND